MILTKVIDEIGYDGNTWYDFVATIRNDNGTLDILDYFYNNTYFNYSSSIYFLDGDDTIVIDNDTITQDGSYLDKIHLGAGNDVLSFSDNTNEFFDEGTTFDGGYGDDIISVAEFRATIYGGVGDDIITAYGQNDQLNGGVGDDTIYTGNGNNEVKGGTGKDIIYAGNGNDEIYGDCHNSQNYELYWCQSNYEMNCEEGDEDIIYAGGGTDLILGGEASDTIYIQTSEAQITYEDWDELGDIIYDFDSNDTIVLADILQRQDWNDIPFEDIILFEQDGSDLIINIDVLGRGISTHNVATLKNYGQASVSESQIIFGQAANHYLTGTDVNGSNLSEIITLEGGKVWAGDGADYITGWEDSNTINGAGGRDTIFGMEGDDRLYGGYGNDKISGGTGEDLIYGDCGNDIIWGNEGNDTIYSGQGDDRIYGGIYSDLIFGGKDNDSIYGESGNDTIYAGWHDDRVFGGSGEDKIRGQSGNDVLYGDGNDDIIMGDGGNDKISGGTGNDIIEGGSGGDRIWGNAGNDIIKSGIHNDKIYGGDGHDTIEGGDGLDSIQGNAGIDTFVFNILDSDYDIIRDYTQNEDRLKINSYLINSGQNNAQDAINNGYINLINEVDGTYIYYDNTGSSLNTDLICILNNYNDAVTFI